MILRLSGVYSNQLSYRYFYKVNNRNRTYICQIHSLILKPFSFYSPILFLLRISLRIKAFNKNKIIN